MTREMEFVRFVPVALAVCASALFLAAAIQSGGRIGVSLDDTWIHLAFARTVGESGRWALTLGAPSGSGTTGYLWPALLAAEMRLGLPPTLAAILPALASFVGLVWLWGRMLRRAGVEPAVAGLSGCILAVSGNLLFLAASGMEAIPCLFLALLALERSAARDRRGCAVAAAALALARPEGCVLGGVLAVLELCRGEESRWPERLGCAALAAIPSIAGLALVLALNDHIGGQAMPNTFLGRRWLYDLPAQPSLSPRALLSGLQQYTASSIGWIAQRVYSLPFGGFLPSGALGLASSGASIALQILAAAGLVGVCLRPGAWLRPFVAYVMLHDLAYVVLLPATGAAARYQPGNLMLAAVLPGLGALALGQLPALASRWKKSTRPAVAVCAAQLAYTLVNAFIWWHVSASSVSHIETVHRAAGIWAAENLPPHARLAAFDVGALAFFCGREIVDYAGLTDADAARALYGSRTLGYLREKGATHLSLLLGTGVSREEALARFGLTPAAGADAPHVELKLLSRFELPPESHWHMPLAGTAEPRMHLFELEWERPRGGGL